MKEYYFIINPKSGSGKRQKSIDLINEVFNKKNIRYQIKFTEYAGHAIEIARSVCNNENYIVVAVGGDGSVNEVAQGLMGGKSSMGILPQGSGNGLARHLKIPMATQGALEVLLSGKSITMDAGTFNGNPFFVTCGIGFDAEVSYNFSKRTTRGLVGYVKESVALYPTYQSKKYRIEANGKSVENEAFSITVANASQYGNEAVIASNASVSDGLLDLCVIKKYPKIFGPQMGIRMFMKNLHNSKYFVGTPTKEVRIKNCNNELECHGHVDGESVVTQFPIEVKIIPKVLNIVVPN
tara:strand:- start:1933 stop:2817 length:885 start_codon:yes stop_codon:yes gene_type:complete